MFERLHDHAQGERQTFTDQAALFDFLAEAFPAMGEHAHRITIDLEFHQAEPVSFPRHDHALRAA
ncbi:MAG: hypothetical protein ACYDHH_02435 [Solirubrobacteraceae bacterium]